MNRRRRSPSGSSRPDYPKKRDWKQGFAQVGIFIRTADGGTTFCSVSDRASPATYAMAVAIFRGADHIPSDVVQAIVAANGDRESKG